MGHETDALMERLQAAKADQDRAEQRLDDRKERIVKELTRTVFANRGWADFNGEVFAQASNELVEALGDYNRARTAARRLREELDG